MGRTLGSVGSRRLERSCGPPSDSIRFGAGGHGLERADVQLARRVFEPHSHDSYAIGVTTAGVQTFTYRGARRVCLPGQFHVLHPDETHDGAPGTSDGFRYRILYVAPWLVRGALGGRPLPFVADPVQQPVPATRAVERLLADIDEPMTELRAADVAVDVADALLALAGHGMSADRSRVDAGAMDRVRERLQADAAQRVPAAELERIAGMDRYTLARQFRWAYGTAPDRYRTLRRLESARRAIESGRSLSDAAAASGFADQSHLTRQFKRAYGFTPARWAGLIAGAGTGRRD